MSGYFINNSQNNDSNGDSPTIATATTGYWEPHTSSIDFCETNYLHSHHIIEPHNVWSSLFGITLFGILGILYGNPTHEWRTTVLYLILIVIGLGSACLHASLHWCFQSADELPMIYLIIGALYCVLEVDTPPKEKSKYPYLASYLIGLGCVNTAIYYTFQHLYIVFLLTFVGMIIMLLSIHVRIAHRLHGESRNPKRTTNSSNNSIIALQFYKWHIIILVFIAFPIWILDQFHCDYLLPIYNNLPFFLRGMTLHVVWHIGAGMASHAFVQFLCAVRVSAFEMKCGVRWLFGGMLPVVVAMYDGESKIGVDCVKQA